MSYGHLDSKQAKAVAAVIRGRVVHDLGCGDGALSGELMSLGAKSVFSVDRKPRFSLRPLRHGVVLVETPFLAYRPKDIDVAFVSWPENVTRPGLIPLCRRARTLIYLGCNFDCTSCGTYAFFEMQLTRRLVASIPAKKNSLIITSDTHCKRRQREPEEAAALNHDDVTLWNDNLMRSVAA